MPNAKSTPGSIEDLLDDAGRLLGEAALPPSPGRPTDPRERLPELGAAIHVALENDGQDAVLREQMLGLGVRIQDRLLELRHHAANRRQHMQAGVREGLGRLSEIRSSADLLDRVCAEAVRSCGMRRVVLSRVDESTWYPWMAHFDGDEEFEQSFVQHIRGITIDLAEAPIERAVLQERRPRIVHDATGDQRYGPIIEASESTSYVVAPITPAGRVVGFLHADHHPEKTTVDTVDRDVLWAFAEGFGRIYERTELLERLLGQRLAVEETLGLVESVTTAIDQTELELEPEGEEGQARSPLALPGDRMQEAVAELLTEREREVLGLVVRGLSNAAVAERLVIKQGTVKTHVKHILRKTGAINRAELIALSMGAITN